MISSLSAWVDLRDIGDDIARTGVLPGLTAMLKMLGYHWRDLKLGRQNGKHSGIADDASDDAIATLALAQAFLLPENHKELRFRQAPSFAEFPFIAIVESKNNVLPRPIVSGLGLIEMQLLLLCRR